MQFESEFRFEVDDSFSMCGQNMSCPSTGTSFSSASSTGTSFSAASSAYDPFTPNSRRSTPNQLSMDFDGTCNSFANPHTLDLTPPPNPLNLTPSTSHMSEYMFGQGPIKAEPEPLVYAEALPSTPMKRMENPSAEYNNLSDVNLAQQSHMGSITPSNSFGMYTLSPETAIGTNSFMMTPSQSLSGSEVADPASVTWSRANESPVNFFHQRPPGSEMEGFDMDRHSVSPMGRYYPHRPLSPNDMRVRRMVMVHELQRKTSELQRAQTRPPRKRSDQPEQVPVESVVRRAMCKCDYPGCKKAFRRNEHLKRHKQTFHDEGGRNRFPCEFCGKDQFNRLDNLKNHRKLHARPNNRNRGVEFIPAAVPIIEQEERCRKRRAPSKAKTGDRRGENY